jgi:hypothetical protein
MLSAPFKIEKGFRHGCPLSGLHFDLFINDLFDELDPLQVPGLPAEAPPIRGLLYADDAVIFAKDSDQVRQATACVERWAQKWQMSFGVTKCGIMRILAGPATGAPELDSLQPVHLHGQSIPFVKEYRYLGAIIDEQLTLEKWMSQKVQAINNSVQALRPFLVSRSAP